MRPSFFYLCFQIIENVPYCTVFRQSNSVYNHLMTKDSNVSFTEMGRVPKKMKTCYEKETHFIFCSVMISNFQRLQAL